MSPGFFEVLPGEVVPFGACEESGSVFGNFLLFLCRAKSVSLRKAQKGENLSGIVGMQGSVDGRT
jgi:hypothetical protein